jgi:hypothetical protein
MADTKGENPNAGPGKPDETRSGAVKPPVLDLTARESAITGKPDIKTETKPEAKPASAVPPAGKPAEKPARPAPEPERGFPVGATIAGGLLGLTAAYGLALGGLWPMQPAPPAPAPVADPRLAQFATAIPELETVTQTTQSELAALNQRIASLEEAEAAPAPAPEVAAVEAPAPAQPAPAAPPVDLSGIEADIAALQSRIDAIPAEPPQPVDVEGLTGEITGLGSRLDELAARLGTAEANLRTLDTTVSETSAALAEQPADIGAVLQLPLVLSGLETAFATGRPFETELASLRAASPDVEPPTGIANSAATGLPRPDLIAQRFDEVLPAIIAGRPADPDAQWQQGAMDWFASAIALRPTGEMEGDSPEAITSRLESAIDRRDFAAAKTLFDALPQPMRAAAGDVPAMVAQQAEAAQFLQTVRQQALTGGAAQ